jgi:CheY-like chemotaxis protein
MTMDFDALPILLAEDNEDDVFIFRRAFQQAGLKHPLHVVSDGQEAVDYLAGVGKFADRARHPLPFLALLDLKLPFRNGLEVLGWIRSRPELRGLEVVVLTSSAEPRDLASARQLGARFYLVKPPKLQALANLLAVFRAERVEGKLPPAPALDGDLFNEKTATDRRGGRGG